MEPLYCQTQAMLRYAPPQFDYFCPNPTYLREGSIPPLHPPPKPPSKGCFWGIACELVGGSERILKTEIPNGVYGLFGWWDMWMGFTRFLNLLKLCMKICW